MTALRVCAITLLAIGPVAIAQGVMITNMTSSTTLFYDDFESVAAGTESFADDDGSVDYDPIATTGSWTITETDGNQIIQVSEYDGAGYPGAIQGDNYLWINRLSTFPKAVGDFAPQSTLGDNIHVEMMVYIRDYNGSSGPGVFSLYDGAGAVGDRSVALSVKDGPDYTINGGGGLTWTPDKWQKWEIDYALGASEYTLTVDGTSANAATSSPGLTAASFRISGNADTEMFIDAVPEPSSIALGVLSAFGLLLYQQKR